MNHPAPRNTRQRPPLASSLRARLLLVVLLGSFASSWVGARPLARLPIGSAGFLGSFGGGCCCTLELAPVAEAAPAPEDDGCCAEEAPVSQASHAPAAPAPTRSLQTEGPTEGTDCGCHTRPSDPSERRPVPQTSPAVGRELLRKLERWSTAVHQTPLPEFLFSAATQGPPHAALASSRDPLQREGADPPPESDAARAVLPPGLDKGLLGRLAVLATFRL